jgi:predicted nucleic acid-binding Zn ribbon protein
MGPEAEPLIPPVVTCTWGMVPFRTLPASAPAASPSSPSAEPVLGAPTSDPEIRVCAVCSKPINGRAEKKACSGRCRIIACRQRRHVALIDRLHAAEDALALAASAVAALRQLAEQGPHASATLAVGH